MRAAILLAAGGSRRFGRGDKLLARIGGRTLLERAIVNVRAAGAGRLIVVVPSTGGRVAREARRAPGVWVVVARNHRRGLGASLRAGLRALRPIEREALIFLADMPGARAPLGLRLPPGADAVRPQAGGTPGHPVLVRVSAAHAAVTCDDRGLFSRLDPGRVALMRATRAQAVDIDTVAALRSARRRRAGRLE